MSRRLDYFLFVCCCFKDAKDEERKKINFVLPCLTKVGFIYEWTCVLFFFRCWNLSMGNIRFLATRKFTHMKSYILKKQNCLRSKQKYQFLIVVSKRWMNEHFQSSSDQLMPLWMLVVRTHYVWMNKCNLVTFVYLYLSINERKDF